MIHGVSEKAATSSSFSERVENALGNFFPFTMGTGIGDEVDTQEEKLMTLSLKELKQLNS